MTREAISPGEFLADELEEIGMTRTEFARQIDVLATRISQCIRGRRDLTADRQPQRSRVFQPICGGVWINACDDINNIWEQIKGMLAASSEGFAEEYAIHD